MGLNCTHLHTGDRVNKQTGLAAVRSDPAGAFPTTLTAVFKLATCICSTPLEPQTCRSHRSTSHTRSSCDSMDPLRCLRNFYTANRLDEVKLVEGRVSFGRGEYEFSGDAKTNFLSSINRQPYSLAQLLLYIQNWDKPHQEYAKLALKAHIQNVYTADRQVLSPLAPCTTL